MDASIKWFELGLQLGVEESNLKVIEQDHAKEGVEVCLRKMISLWLKTINPRPSWEGLVAALETPSVRCFMLAQKIRRDLQDEADHDSPTASSDGTGWFHSS